MYVLVTYDVQTSDPQGAKRLRKVARICKNYGQRVQNSVFECLVTPAQMVSLEQELSSNIDHSSDSLRIYQLGSNYKRNIKIIGKETSFDLEGELLI